jgi:hypothetical protein
MLASAEQCGTCQGPRLEGDHCLAHLTGAELDAVARRLGESQPLDARGVVITAERLTELLDRLRSGDGRPRLPVAHFERARFEAANFEDVRFLGDAHFDDARFDGDARFARTQFAGDAHFDHAIVGEVAHFQKAQFAKEADFRWVEAKSGRFKEAQFSGEARFDRAGFSSGLDLRAGFRRRTSLGRIGVLGALVLDNAVFDEDLRLDATAKRLSCVRTRFSGRADLNVCWAEINLEEATFAYSSRLAGFERPPDQIQLDVRRAWRKRPRSGASDKPVLMSIRRANVENLAVHNMDLSSCRFVDAFGLDQMTIDVSCDFAQTPSRRYTRRRIVVEEQELRWRHGSSPTTQTHGDVAAIYRSLRKALEDHKDEPGAADFYYGEMEMRRLTHPPTDASRSEKLASFGERLILRLYWLVSGYGLRASRAFAALLVTVLVFAVCFYVWGFDDEPFWRALLFSAQSTTSLFKAPDSPQPEPVGEALQLALRLLGPLFFALALLSLRGRVKR